MALRRPREAVQALERAVELSPEVKEAHLDLVVAYLAAGDHDKATAAWNRLKSLPDVRTRADYDRLIRAATESRHHALVVDLCREVLHESPGDVQLLGRLAGAYRDTGQLELARSTLRHAAEVEPALRADVERLLQSLVAPSR